MKQINKNMKHIWFSTFLLLLLVIINNNVFAQFWRRVEPGEVIKTYKDGTELLSFVNEGAWGYCAGIAGVRINIPNKGKFLGIVDCVNWDEYDIEDGYDIKDEYDIKNLEIFNLPFIWGTFTYNNGKEEQVIYGKTISEWKNINNKNKHLGIQWKINVEGHEYTLLLSPSGNGNFKTTESYRGYIPQIGSRKYDPYTRSWKQTVSGGGYFYDVICEVNQAVSWSVLNDTLIIRYLEPSVSSKVEPDVYCPNCEPTYAKQWANQVRSNFATNRNVKEDQKISEMSAKEQNAKRTEKFVVLVSTDDIFVIKNISNGVYYEYAKNNVKSYATLHNILGDGNCADKIINTLIDIEFEELENERDSIREALCSMYNTYKNLFDNLTLDKIYEKRAKTFEAIYDRQLCYNNVCSSKFYDNYKGSIKEDIVRRKENMDKLNVFNFYYKKIDTLNYYTIALKKISKNICPDVFEAYHAHYLKIEKTFEFYAQLEEYLKLPLLANEFSRQNECYKFINNRKTIDENHKK